MIGISGSGQSGWTRLGSHTTSARSNSFKISYGNSPQLDNYSSRDDEYYPSDGFPSANDQLALVVRNTSDPNGYYSELGVVPWIGHKNLVRHCRKLLAKYHPDGGTPNLERFQRIEEIYRVLGDPKARMSYDLTPEGSKFIDSKVKREMMDQLLNAGVSADELNDLVTELTAAQRALQRDPEKPVRWDFFSQGRTGIDCPLVEDWYPHLLKAARAIGYRGVIKVYLTHTKHYFSPRSGIVWLPRSIVPSFEEAQVVMGSVTEM